MIKRIATVGGWTLVSRISGFIRDVVMAAVLGAGPMADAFFVAFRLPNHFRAIFAEGAFAAAFVPAYARVLQQADIDPAKLFADRIAAALIAINLVLLSLALLFTPWVVSSSSASGLKEDLTASALDDTPDSSVSCGAVGAANSSRDRVWMMVRISGAV